MYYHANRIHSSKCFHLLKEASRIYIQPKCFTLSPYLYVNIHERIMKNL